jgi:hypothetical protein
MLMGMNLVYKSGWEVLKFESFLPNTEPHVIYKFENPTHTWRTYQKNKLSVKIKTGGSIKKEELANTHRQQTITK